MKTDKKRLQTIINNFKRARILVVGDVILDHFIWGRVDRISPEAPVPVVEVTSESLIPGGAANVAMNLHSIGATTDLVGITGKDTHGKILKDLLKRSKIGYSGIITMNNRVTTKKSRIIAHHQQVVRVDREKVKPLSLKEEQTVIKKLRSIIPGYQAVIIEDYGKGLISQRIINEIIDCCRSHGIFTALDPKKGHFLRMEGLSLCTPNLSEALFLGQSANPGFVGEILDNGDQLRQTLGLDQLLITLGEDGMALFIKDGKPFHIPTKAKEVFDVSGAGDTVISLFTASIVSGAKPFEAAYLANVAAGIVVGKLGTATVNCDEILNEI